MRSYQGALIMIWWTVTMIIAAPTLVKSSETVEGQLLAYSTVTLNLENPTTAGYSTFMTSLRNQLKSSEVTCNLPMTKKSPKDTERFVLADLKVSSTISVKLAIDVSNLYVVAYGDRFDNKDRANFLKDAPKVAKDNLFKGATVRNLGFGGRYQDFESAAGQSRDQVQLGLESLKYAAKAVYGQKKVDQKVEGKFFIIAVQMISEAARFKYIEQVTVNKKPSDYFKPDPKVLKLENSWDPISAAIIATKPKCGDLKTALKLKNADNTDWTVTKVSQISPDMGLLKTGGSKLQAFVSDLFTQMWMMHDNA